LNVVFFLGITRCRTDVTVHVKVIDRSMPVFKKQFYSEVVPENVELHSPLSISIEAESPLSRKLIYSIVKGNELEEFALDFNTGRFCLLWKRCEWEGN
jgi:protocadherin Fat 1/2/3